MIKEISIPFDGRQLATGQLWRYHTRPGEESSRLIINRIDLTAEHGPIYHISVLGLQIHQGNNMLTEINHAPISQEPLLQSLIELVDDQVVYPEYEEGYNKWQEAYEEENAGIFTLDVAALVEMIELTVNTRH